MDQQPETPFCKRVLDLKPEKDDTSIVKKEERIGSGELHHQPEHLT
jgi:hypothetical protein